MAMDPSMIKKMCILRRGDFGNFVLDTLKSIGMKIVSYRILYRSLMHSLSNYGGDGWVVLTSYNSGYVVQNIEDFKDLMSSEDMTPVIFNLFKAGFMLSDELDPDRAYRISVDYDSSSLTGFIVYRDRDIDEQIESIINGLDGRYVRTCDGYNVELTLSDSDDGCDSEELRGIIKELIDSVLENKGNTVGADFRGKMYDDDWFIDYVDVSVDITVPYVDDNRVCIIVRLS